jgi:hypothetical protein
MQGLAVNNCVDACSFARKDRFVLNFLHRFETSRWWARCLLLKWWWLLLHLISCTALKLAGGGRDVSCSSGGGCCCMDYPEPSTQPESVLGKTGLDLLISFGGIFVLITCQ